MSRNIDALTNSDLEQIRSNSAYVLPNNPTQQGWSAERIKDKLWKPAQLLFYIIQKVQADEIADFDEFTAFVKALTEEGSKIALRAKEDSNGNVIIETYETKADAKSTLENLESEISAEQTARISGDNSTLSTAKSYSNANLETAKTYANTKKAEAIDYTKDVYANHKIEYNDLNSRVTESEADITSLFDRTSSVSLAYDNKTGVLSITVNGQTKTMDLDLERAGIAYSIDESTGELVITDSTGAVKRYALSKILNLMTGTDTDTIDVTVENGNVSAVVKDGSISLDKLDSTTKSAMQSAISAQSEEATRIANELARETAETTRQSNESTRQSNEETRKSNEATRQSNETARQANFETAISDFNAKGDRAISTIQSEWGLIKNSVDAKTYGVRFYNNAKDGTRCYDAVDMVANVSKGDGVEVVNDFDSVPIFSEIHKVRTEARDSSGNVLTDNDGNVIYNDLVWVPNFYIRHLTGTDSDGNTYDEWSVSTQKRQGYHAAFVQNDKECRGMLGGAYFTTTLKDKAQASGTPCCGCQKGQNPRVNLGLPNIDSYMCYVKEEDYGVGLQKLHGAEDLQLYSALAVLMTVEFATRDHQSVFYGVASEEYDNPMDSTLSKYNNPDGVANYETAKLTVYKGNSMVNASVGDEITIYDSTEDGAEWVSRTVTAIDDATVSGYRVLTLDKSIHLPASGEIHVCRNWGGKVGKLDGINATSGYESEALEKAGLAHFSYRGFEDVYGNLWSILSGYALYLNPSEEPYGRHLARLSSYRANSTDNATIMPETQLPSAEGWVKAFSMSEDDNGAVIFPTEVGGGSASHYCDYHYMDSPSSATWRAISVGGYGGSGAGAGSFFWYVPNWFGDAWFIYGLRPSIFVE